MLLPTCAAGSNDCDCNGNSPLRNAHLFDNFSENAMTGHSEQPALPLWKRLLCIVLFPIVLPAALFGMAVFVLFAACATLYFLPIQIWRERKFRRYLREKGRLMDVSEIEPRLQAGEGTLLEEWGPGGPCRIWWTSDELMSEEPPMQLNERLRALFGD